MDRPKPPIEVVNSMFGPEACMRTTGLTIKDTGEPAVGVGFQDGDTIRIQGKGLTWEEAIARAESRRDIWEPELQKVRELKKAEANTPRWVLNLRKADKEPTPVCVRKGCDTRRYGYRSWDTLKSKYCEEHKCMHCVRGATIFGDKKQRHCATCYNAKFTRKDIAQRRHAARKAKLAVTKYLKPLCPETDVRKFDRPRKPLSHYNEVCAYWLNPHEKAKRTREEEGITGNSWMGSSYLYRYRRAGEMGCRRVLYPSLEDYDHSLSKYSPYLQQIVNPI